MKLGQAEYNMYEGEWLTETEFQLEGPRIPKGARIVEKEIDYFKGKVILRWIREEEQDEIREQEN